MFENHLERLRTLAARRFILIAASLFLLSGLVVSLRQRPDLLSGLEWRHIGFLIAFAIPANLVLNGIDFQLTARLVGRRLALRDALEVTVLSSAANMLPLPGGVIVRVAALRVAGASIRSGTSVTLYLALIWFGISCVAAAVAMGRIDRSNGALIFSTLGLIGLSIGFISCVRTSGRISLSLSAVALKGCAVVLGAIRLLLCFAAVGQIASFEQCVVVVISTVVGSAAAIVPAGLGINEAVAAGLAPLVGLSSAVAFVVTLLNRIFGLAVILPLALALATSSGRATRGDNGTNG